MDIAKLNEYVALARSKYSHTPMDYEIDAESGGIYPFWDKDASECKPSVVNIFTMVEKKTRAKVHNVVLAYEGEGYAIWCGDNFLEGGTNKPPAQDRIDMAAAEIPAHVTNGKARLGELQASVAPSTGCHFWQQFAKGNLCKHCYQVLALKHRDLPELLENLKQTYASDVLGEASAAPVTAVPQELFARLASKVPVLLEGEKGWGKTREARMFASANGSTVVEIHGHESVEAADLTGYTVRYGHEMVWKDGRLSQAFRSASKGIKTTLVLDELLRIPQRQLSVLLSALSPHEGNYYLATGRMIAVEDGIGVEETIVCACENLFIVGTTNVGVQYAVDAMDPALQERFLLVRKDTDVTILKSAVLAAVLAKGFPEFVADDCVSFFGRMKDLKAHGLVNDLPNPRTMLRAVHLSDKFEDMKDSVLIQALTWVQRDVDGNPVQEQMDAVVKVINKVWR